MGSRALHKTVKKAGKNSKTKARARARPSSSTRTSAARIVVEVKHRANVTYQRELVKCGKAKCKRCRRRAAHGPYWYGYWRSWSRAGRVVSKYIGKELPERTLDGWD